MIRNDKVDITTENEPEDVAGHYLPLDDEGHVDLAPHLVETVEDVEGHASDFGLDIERKR